MIPSRPRKRPVARRRGIRRRKTTNADFLRSWGLSPLQWMRYTGLKGIYWVFFSRMIRNRDYQEHGGLCMTCLQYVERGQDQCGHLIDAQHCGFALLFHPINNHLQHAKCNNPRFTPSAGVNNAINIEKRYGVGTVEKLLEMKKEITPEWNKDRYIEELAKLGVYPTTT